MSHAAALPIAMAVALLGVLGLYYHYHRVTLDAFQNTFGRAFNVTPSFLTASRDLYLLRTAHHVEAKAESLALALMPLADESDSSFFQGRQFEDTLQLKRWNARTERGVMPAMLGQVDLDATVNHSSPRHKGVICVDARYDSAFVMWNPQYQMAPGYEAFLAEHKVWQLGGYRSHYLRLYQGIGNELMQATQPGIADSLPCARIVELLESRSRQAVDTRRLIAFAYCAVRAPQDSVDLKTKEIANQALEVILLKQAAQLRGRWRDRAASFANALPPDTLATAADSNWFLRPWTYVGFPATRLDATYNPLERDWFEQAYRRRGPYWSSVYGDVSTGIPVLTCSTVIPDPHGLRPAGVVALDVFPKQLLSLSSPGSPLTMNLLWTFLSAMLLWGILWAGGLWDRQAFAVLAYAYAGLFAYYVVRLSTWLVDPQGQVAREVTSALADILSILNSGLFLLSAVVTFNALAQMSGRKSGEWLAKMNEAFQKRAGLEKFMGGIAAAFGIWLMSTLVDAIFRPKVLFGAQSDALTTRQAVDTFLSICAIVVFGWRFGSWLAESSRKWLGVLAAICFFCYATLQIPIHTPWENTAALWLWLVFAKIVCWGWVLLALYLWMERKARIERNSLGFHRRVLNKISKLTGDLIVIGGRGKRHILFANDVGRRFFGWKNDEVGEADFGEGLWEPSSDRYSMGTLFGAEKHAQIRHELSSRPIQHGEVVVEGLETTLIDGNNRRVDATVSVAAWLDHTPDGHACWYSVGVARTHDQPSQNARVEEPEG